MSCKIYFVFLNTHCNGKFQFWTWIHKGQTFLYTLFEFWVTSTNGGGVISCSSIKIRGVFLWMHALEMYGEVDLKSHLFLTSPQESWEFSLELREKGPLCSLNRMLGCPHGGSERFAEERNLLPLPGIDNYSENHTKPIDTLCGKILFLNVTASEKSI